MIATLGVFGLACSSSNNSTPTGSNTAPSAAASPTAAGDELAVANEQYQKQCIACHGEKGAGGTVTMKDVTLKVPSLREGEAVTRPDERLVKQVLEGGEGMPAFKDKLSTREAADLIKYIRREFQGK